MPSFNSPRSKPMSDSHNGQVYNVSVLGMIFSFLQILNIQSIENSSAGLIFSVSAGVGFLISLIGSVFLKNRKNAKLIFFWSLMALSLPAANCLFFSFYFSTTFYSVYVFLGFLITLSATIAWRISSSKKYSGSTNNRYIGPIAALGACCTSVMLIFIPESTFIAGLLVTFNFLIGGFLLFVIAILIRFGRLGIH